MDALTDEDIAILDLESPTIAGHTCKVIVIDDGPGTPTVEDVRAHMAARLDRVPRCQQCLCLAPVAEWTEPSPLDMGKHVRLAPAGDDLADVVAWAMSGRLDRGRPLWDLELVPDVGEDRWALVWRVHHCMADGMTMMRWASDLFWDEPADAAKPHPHPAAPSGQMGARPLAALGAAARTVLSVGRELRPARGSGPFTGRAGTRRHAAFARCTLGELRTIEHGAGAGVTMNDVILAAVAGALRRWCVQHGAALEGARVKVPVSMHLYGADAHDLGNRDSFMFVDLPIDEPDPEARLHAVNRETRERKAHHDAEAVYDVLDFLERVAPPLAGLATRALENPREFSVNVSNVPGPRAGVTVLGRPVHGLYSFAEIGDRHPVRIAAVSLDGVMQFGLLSDPDRVPGVDALAAGMEASIAELLS